MKNKKTYALLVAFTLCFVTNFFGQHGSYRIKNGFGVMGALTQYDILTDNFETKAGNSWLLGASATLDIPHKWYNVSYNIQLSENKIEIAGRPTNLTASEEFIEYKMFAAQVAMMMHVKLVKSYITFDFGPMLQYNDKLQLKDKNQETFFINNYSNLTAEDVTDISKFNFDGAVGITAGYEFIKLRAQYIYGFTNILNKLNKNNLDTAGSTETKFKGNQSMLVFGLMITF